jgi:CO dehydrogenase/acetyl-CoA synthase beta subunit
MAIKSNLDPETKIELLIKLAFGIPFEDLTEEYKLSKNKIINLRKNNYKLYNKFFEHWKIEKEIAVLGLCPKHERALNIVKKFYKNKVEVISKYQILYKGETKNINEIIEMADEILQKDNICCFKTLEDIKNYY